MNAYSLILFGIAVICFVFAKNGKRRSWLFLLSCGLLLLLGIGFDILLGAGYAEISIFLSFFLLLFCGD